MLENCNQNLANKANNKHYITDNAIGSSVSILRTAVYSAALLTAGALAYKHIKPVKKLLQSV